MRLRILDLNTPWFWLTAFYVPKAYGKPWLEGSGEAFAPEPVYREYKSLYKERV